MHKLVLMGPKLDLKRPKLDLKRQKLDFSVKFYTILPLLAQKIAMNHKISPKKAHLRPKNAKTRFEIKKTRF